MRGGDSADDDNDDDREDGIMTGDVGRRRARRAPAEPDFIGKSELARHLCCDVGTIDDWIVAGSIPPPHARPGARHPIWRRDHYRAFVETGEWPRAAYGSPSMNRVESSSFTSR
jgi:hypothetical protein